jgi:hypothetical protein
MNNKCFTAAIGKYDKTVGLQKIKNSMFKKFMILEFVEDCRVNKLQDKLSRALSENLITIDLAFRVLSNFSHNQPPRTLSSVLAFHRLIDLLITREGHLSKRKKIQRSIRWKLKVMSAYEVENASYFHWIPENKKQLGELENLLNTQHTVHAKVGATINSSINNSIRQLEALIKSKKDGKIIKQLKKELEDAIYKIANHKSHGLYWFPPNSEDKEEK